MKGGFGKQALIVIVAFLMAAFFVPGIAQAAEIDSDQRVLYELINKYRTDRGLSRLNWGYRIERACERHSKDMVAKDYLKHTEPDGTTIRRRLKDACISRWGRATELLADSGKEVWAFNNWRGTKTTRMKLLNPEYTHIGIGIVDGGEHGKIITVKLLRNPKLKKRIIPESKTLLNMINKKRQEVGAPRLNWGYKLAKAGRHHSRDMLENSYFSHKSKDGRNLTDRLYLVGVTGWRRAGENIAGTSSNVRAFELWMESDSHRKNMLDPKFTHVGIGFATNGSFTIYTMDLVAR